MMRSMYTNRANLTAFYVPEHQVTMSSPHSTLLSMSSTNGGHYDRNLLAHAPVATRAQLQEGYDTVLLEPNRAKRSQSDVALTVISKEQAQSTPTRSFWQSRKRHLIGALIALVILAAILGGAVGSTAKKKKTQPDTSHENTSTSTLSSATSTSGIFGAPVIFGSEDALAAFSERCNLARNDISSPNNSSDNCATFRYCPETMNTTLRPASTVL
ncbi:hypothetical protein C8J57DRAFT_149762 [Mycena rebaudengoi]|nr:hypothetical protein C8J57DRAFT_149762 [Mycena rebaudengoi]